MNIFELIFFILLVWIIAWLTTLFSMDLALPLLAASSIFVFTCIFVVGITCRLIRKFSKTKATDEPDDPNAPSKLS